MSNNTPVSDKVSGGLEEAKKELEMWKDEVEKFAKCRQDLLDKLKRCQAELEARRAESTKLKQKFKIYAQIPDTEVRFSAQDEEEADDNSQPIRGVFSISQRSTVPLQGGQALITFEEEKVASQILKIAKCSVSCDNKNLEVHLDVSRKDIKVSNVPPSMPVERMKDRLEISFSRPSRGGGEVERVEYDKSTGLGTSHFCTLESLALRGKYTVDLDTEVNVHVGPVYKHQLRKFQTFCGSPKRTILMDDIKDMSDEEDLQDYLEIHFQKPSNCGVCWAANQSSHLLHVERRSGPKNIVQCPWSADVKADEDSISVRLYKLIVK
ncbi:hypothetical protein INR49_030010 [Caranx melampygus]|nr:hypothetical protein INR49_030010 [Caranx melampygus]